MAAFLSRALALPARNPRRLHRRQRHHLRTRHRSPRHRRHHQRLQPTHQRPVLPQRQPVTRGQMAAFLTPSPQPTAQEPPAPSPTTTAPSSNSTSKPSPPPASPTAATHPPTTTTAPTQTRHQRTNGRLLIPGAGHMRRAFITAALVVAAVLPAPAARPRISRTSPRVRRHTPSCSRGQPRTSLSSKTDSSRAT